MLRKAGEGRQGALTRALLCASLVVRRNCPSKRRYETEWCLRKEHRPLCWLDRLLRVVGRRSAGSVGRASALSLGQESEERRACLGKEAVRCRQNRRKVEQNGTESCVRREKPVSQHRRCMKKRARESQPGTESGVKTESRVKLVALPFFGRASVKACWVLALLRPQLLVRV